MAEQKVENYFTHYKKRYNLHYFQFQLSCITEQLVNTYLHAFLYTFG